MKKLTFLFILIFMSNQMLAQTPTKSETVSVNGKKLYYEVYGEGSPLIFLHGYTLSSVAWRPYVSDFIDEYQVFLIDLTGHGKSEPFKDDLTIKGVGEDLHALIQYLKLDKIKAVGFSFGGDVLYQLALLNPELIESMITIGALGTWDVNDFPGYLEAFTFKNKANFSWLESSHESDAQIKGLMEQFKNYTVYLAEEELKQIQPEVLIMMGDDDEGMDFDEVARVKKYLPNSDIWILPNETHGAHEGANKPDFVKHARKFLSKN